MLVHRIVFSAFFTCLMIFSATHQHASAEVYELRTYTTHEGKLKNLNARFRNHTVKLFNKHGMESIGYWVPTDGPKAKNTLIYVLKHQSREAAAKSWKAFLSDPAWKKVAQRISGGMVRFSPKDLIRSS